MTAGEATSSEEQVLRLLGGRIISAAVSAAANLGIPDALSAGPLGGPALAERIEADASMLERLMTVLVGAGVFARDEAGDYVLTDVGRALGDMRPLATFMGARSQWLPWSSLADGIRAGKSPYLLANGEELYPWLESHPDDAELYDRGVERFTAEQAKGVAALYDFSEAEHVVDIGGGQGATLLELLRRYPHVEATFVDLPPVVAQTKARFEAEGLASRCRFVAQSFFDPLPAGADHYILQHVLHNWGDVPAVRILDRCREALGETGRLVIVEGMLQPGIDLSIPRMVDLEMLVLFGHGRERTKLELKKLFQQAGLRMGRYTASMGVFARLMVADPPGSTRAPYRPV